LARRDTKIIYKTEKKYILIAHILNQKAKSEINILAFALINIFVLSSPPAGAS
jgi:hypothetical protein